MMGFEVGDGPRFDTLGSLDADVVLPFGGRAVAVAVPVIEGMLRIIEGLDPLIPAVYVFYRVGPAQIVVVSERQHWAPEKCRPREAPAFPAVQVGLVVL